MVFAAGACPIDEDGVVVPGGIEAQARKAVENLFAALSAAGAAPGRRPEDDGLRRLLRAEPTSSGRGT